MKISVSVPGKIILMGDHAVVHGKPGLIAAVNRRLTVQVSCRKRHTQGIYLTHSRDYTKSFSAFDTACIYG